MPPTSLGVLLVLLLAAAIADVVPSYDSYEHRLPSFDVAFKDIAVDGLVCDGPKIAIVYYPVNGTRNQVLWHADQASNESGRVCA